MKVFLLPFAGANRYSYYEFSKKSTDQLLFIPLEIPGRGRRFKESLLDSIDSMVNDIVCQLNVNPTEKYALFGHSMGAIIGYKLIHHQIKNNLPMPIHLFVSGSAGPSFINKHEILYNLPKDEFFKKISELGGIKPEVQNDNELLDFFEPILRADFKAVETFQHVESPKLNLPITVLAGDSEVITNEQLLLWQEETIQSTETIIMKGNHFFIFDHVDEIIKLVLLKLAVYVS